MDAKLQHQAMLRLLERGMELPLLQRVEIAAAVMAAQVALNGLLIDELEQLKARLDLADQRRAKAQSLALEYIDRAVKGGAVPIEVAEEFQRNLEECDRVN